MTESFQKKLSKVIEEYRKSKIQSESEVRSKFVVPFLDALGYPAELRAEEFNVYGYAGGEKLKAKPADYIIFKDKNFADYRKNTRINKKWVEDNSLIIIEAKKPNEMPKDHGQAKFYTMWTKAIAYIITDGEKLCAYYYSLICSDYEVIEEEIDNLTDASCISKLESLTYQSILSAKKSAYDVKNEKQLSCLMNGAEINLLDKITNLGLPEHTINYMQYALGQNANGLTEVELTGRFLNMTDSYLMNEMRYEIPKYMIDIPRNIYKASLYVDNSVFPLINGEITEYYREELTRFYFESDYINVFIEYRNEKLVEFEIDYSVLDISVIQRLNSFELVRKCLWADTITIVVDSIKDDIKERIFLPVGKPKKMWKTKQYMLKTFEFWVSEMKKLKAIEEYYEIEFKLLCIQGEEALNNLYDSIDIVYDGMNLCENANLKISGNTFDYKFIIDIPILLEENKDIPLDDQIIHGFIFKPRRSAILPCNVDFNGKTEEDILSLPICIGYDVYKSV